MYVLEILYWIENVSINSKNILFTKNIFYPTHSFVIIFQQIFEGSLFAVNKSNLYSLTNRFLCFHIILLSKYISIFHTFLELTAYCSLCIFCMYVYLFKLKLFYKRDGVNWTQYQWLLHTRFFIILYLIYIYIKKKFIKCISYANYLSFSLMLFENIIKIYSIFTVKLFILTCV